MYCYRPKKKKEQWWIIIVIAGLMLLADISRPQVHAVIDRMHEDHTMTIVNEITPEYDPCALETVICEGEEQPEITKITPEDEIDMIIKNYFGEDWKLARAIMMSEGCYDTTAFNPTNNSNDRGIWQISRRWHPEVDDACARDVKCSTKETYRISKGGTDWHEWSGYLFGRYKKFL